MGWNHQPDVTCWGPHKKGTAALRNDGERHLEVVIRPGRLRVSATTERDMWYHKCFLFFTEPCDTVDGRNLAHQLRMIVYPIIYRVLEMGLFSGCWTILPSLKSIMFAPERWWLEDDCFLFGRPIFRGYVSFRGDKFPSIIGTELTRSSRHSRVVKYDHIASYSHIAP